MNSPLTLESPAVLKHIDIYQALINRMAANSAACKQWAITLVSAILVFALEKGSAEAAAVALIPVLMFCFLDAYYLALERQFRNTYSDFLDGLHGVEDDQGQKKVLDINSLYRITTTGKLPAFFKKALSSWAVMPFYVGICTLVFLVFFLVVYFY